VRLPKALLPNLALLVLPLVLPLAAGVSVRFVGLDHQVAGGDEMHAVRSALAMPLDRILVTYRPSDNCIPLTALYRWLMDQGLRPSELSMRAPALICGVLLLVVAPAWILRRLDLRPAVITTWLLALCPALVYYSRLIRSYSPIVFLSFCAVVAFDSWMRRRNLSSAAIYVVSGTLATYFHLVAAPLIFSPLVFVGLARLAGIRGMPSWRAIFWLLGVLIGSHLGFLLPAIDSVVELVMLKHETLDLNSDTWLGILVLWSGSGSPLLSVVFLLLSAKGLVSLYLRDRLLAAYIASLLVGHTVGLLILSPKAMHQATILHRYMLVLTPWVMLLVALGLASRWIPRRDFADRQFGLALALLFIAGSTATGPLRHREYLFSPFSLRPEVLLLHFGPTPETPITAEVYERMADDNPGPVVEYPWHTTWRFSKHLTAYQKSHKRKVLVAPGERLLWDDAGDLGFRNMVTPRVDDILASPAAYLVVHQRSEEEAALLDRQDPADKGSPLAKDREQRRKDLLRFDRQVANRLPELIDRLGQPDGQSGGILLWDLTRIRGQR